MLREFERSLWRGTLKGFSDEVELEKRMWTGIQKFQADEKPGGITVVGAGVTNTLVQTRAKIHEAKNP